MNKTGWIILALLLISGFTALVVAFGAVGVVAGVLGSVAFFVGLDQLYRWRSRRLAGSLHPDETLLASGLVSEEAYDETAAVLVRNDTNRYRLLVADTRGAVSVESVTPALARHSSPYDQKSYIELHTPKGPMHFAPRKGLLITGQAQHAQQLLDTILPTLLPSPPLNGA